MEHVLHDDYQYGQSLFSRDFLYYANIINLGEAGHSGGIALMIGEAHIKRWKSRQKYAAPTAKTT